jgi:putative flippase GtrA
MSFIQRSLRFGIVGITTALLYYALLFVAVELLLVEPVTGSSIVYVIVIFANYLMHYSWTFAAASPHTTALKRYFFMVACGFVLNLLLMYVGVTVLALNYLLVQGAAMGVVIVWNFVVSSLWVFRQ